MQRLIDRDPVVTLETLELFDFTPVEESRYGSGRDDLGPWSTADGETRTTATPEGIRLESASSRSFLFHASPVEAADVDVLEVELGGSSLATGPVSLAWTTPRTGFSARRELQSSGRDAGGAATYRFVLRGHPEWTGTISRLRLAIPRRPDGVLVKKIVLAQAVVRPERLATMLDGGVKAELDDEVRNAIPGVPGMPLERHVSVPHDATLRLSYGLPETVRQAVRFRVSFIPDGGEGRVLFEDSLDPGAQAGRWFQASRSLTPLAGQSGRLELETFASESFDLIRGLPLWGNPRISRSSAADAPNVVLISVDTLRADRLSLYGYQRDTSPVLDRWARESATVFTSAVAQSTWTLPSHVSMLSGVDTFHHGINFYEQSAGASLRFLSEILRDAGYFTMAATGGALLHPRYGFIQGFDRYRYYSGNRASGEEISDGLGRVLQWVQEGPDTPFFLFFHTYEVHTPWRSRQPHYRRFSDLPPVEDLRISVPDPRPEEGFLGKIEASNLDLRGPLPGDGSRSALDLLAIAGAAYDSGIAYTDERLGELFAKLESAGLAENTVVVFTSDHGELLGEHDVIGHRYLYEENILVPLVISSPDGRGAGARVESQVRSIDIVPTVLELVGLDVPQEIDGESLVPLLVDPDSPGPGAAFTYAPEVNYGISVRLENRLKYTFNDTVWPPLWGREALYSLDPPDETVSILPGFDGIDRLRALASEAVGSAPGLRVRVASGDDARFSGVLRGSDLRPNRVKSLELPCACVSHEPWGARFEVPAGQSYTLSIQGAGNDVIHLQIDADSPGGGFAMEIDRADFGPGIHRVVALSDSGWKEIVSEKVPATFVELWWEGEIAASTTDPSEVDPELVERLRALGYIR